MGCPHVIEIKIQGDIGIGNDDIFFLLDGNEIHEAGQRLYTSIVYFYCFFRKGWNHVQTAIFADQIPLAAGA